ncbi:uncharacterized protein C8Q71DRAFT_791771 [Rhodofomes roseus]|uniref:Uncharacterized protein n=1 Tax=Rhodofomes roseus TaxID=34475 RepID=A0ABQ8JYK9_9APHY|nr:uncharacterized protein C8Q71DRAFT_791771 [Rhodofomes roseus]KAH9829107.1 hypothetical protein C8Q71DRAFT_791771 [Rhodofomes roseus]
MGYDSITGHPRRPRNQRLARPHCVAGRAARQWTHDRCTVLDTMAHNILNNIRDGIAVEGRRDPRMEARSDTCKLRRRSGRPLNKPSISLRHIAESESSVTAMMSAVHFPSSVPLARPHTQGSAPHRWVSLRSRTCGAYCHTTGCPGTNVIVLQSPCFRSPHQVYPGLCFASAEGVPPSATTPLPPPRTHTPLLASSPPPIHLLIVYMIKTPFRVAATLPVPMPFKSESPCRLEARNRVA